MRFAEFRTGQIIDAGTTCVDEASILEFARRFDPQPFHVDKAAAEGGRWGGLIASGFHTCSMAMRLVADAILSNSESCGSPGLDHIKWPAPVRPGDSLQVKVEVLDVRRSRSGDYGIVRWQWRMSNQQGQIVLDLIATSLFGLCAMNISMPVASDR
jgi:acyl dehydratase